MFKQPTVCEHKRHAQKLLPSNAISIMFQLFKWHVPSINYLLAKLIANSIYEVATYQQRGIIAILKSQVEDTQKLNTKSHHTHNLQVVQCLE